ncbi:MAG: DUF3379 domain-containing protein [Xanthomonadales bacterium]|jgi:hypothetical protein|nr:DUF3379 domain-containing protein [Xanthomonadales bacterium]
MNYLEFKRQLMVDPYSKDQDFLDAKGRDAEFAEAADEADAFEQSLQDALTVEVPPGLAEQIMLRTSIEEGLRDQPQVAQQKVVRPMWPQALAAGIFAAAVTAGVMSWQHATSAGGPGSMETFVVDHWQHHGDATLQQASTEFSSAQELRQVLASVGVEATEEFLRQIRYGANCPTPKGKGAHLVLNTEHGPITLFYAPKVESGTSRMSIDDVVAILVEMQSGSAALVGEEKDEDSMRKIGDMINENLRPMSTNT